MPVIVEASGASVQTYALLGNGSDKTLVTDKLSTEFNTQSTESESVEMHAVQFI